MRRGILRLCALVCALTLGAGFAEGGVDLLAVDHRLYELGYRDGACSGVLDDVMVNALKNFQRVNGLGVTGEPDAGTILVLNSDSAVSQADYLARLSQQNAAVPPMAAGAYGDEVVRLQRALKELGYFDGAADGAFGDSTVEAVYRFQLANGLRLTGAADGALLARLYGDGPLEWQSFLRSSVASVGDEGEAVRALQQWLGRKGLFTGECTGRYGENTQRAVRRFQTGLGLEASGNFDMTTCRSLYGNMTALLADAATLRVGSAGAQELCARLSALGYAAHESFDMQTELALMQFQQANGLAVTGAADAPTASRLNAPSAVGRAGYVASGAEAAQAEDFGARIVQSALRLVGEMTGFDEEFGLVQYVYLECGVAVADRAQFAPVDGAPQPGDMMAIAAGDAELWGLTSTDGAIIYRDGSGRVVMGYPEAMGVDSVRAYRLGAQ